MFWGGLEHFTRSRPPTCFGLGWIDKTIATRPGGEELFSSRRLIPIRRRLGDIVLQAMRRGHAPHRDEYDKPQQEKEAGRKTEIHQYSKHNSPPCAARNDGLHGNPISLAWLKINRFKANQIYKTLAFFTYGP